MFQVCLFDAFSSAGLMFGLILLPNLSYCSHLLEAGSNVDAAPGHSAHPGPTTSARGLSNRVRFRQDMNVFKILEATVPSNVESRIIAFLDCLSAQQSFILRVMSVIGTRGIEADLLEVRTADTRVRLV